MLGWEGDTAQELERAVKHPNPNGDPALGCAGVQKKGSAADGQEEAFLGKNGTILF